MPTGIISQGFGNVNCFLKMRRNNTWWDGKLKYSNTFVFHIHFKCSQCILAPGSDCAFKFACVLVSFSPYCVFADTALMIFPWKSFHVFSLFPSHICPVAPPQSQPRRPGATPFTQRPRKGGLRWAGWLTTAQGLSSHPINWSAWHTCWYGPQSQRSDAGANVPATPAGPLGHHRTSHGSCANAETASCWLTCSLPSPRLFFIFQLSSSSSP